MFSGKVKDSVKDFTVTEVDLFGKKANIDNQNIPEYKEPKEGSRSPFLITFEKYFVEPNPSKKLIEVFGEETVQKINNIKAEFCNICHIKWFTKCKKKCLYHKLFTDQNKMIPIPKKWKNHQIRHENNQKN